MVQSKLKRGRIFGLDCMVERREARIQVVCKVAGWASMDRMGCLYRARPSVQCSAVQVWLVSDGSGLGGMERRGETAEATPPLDN